MKSLKNDQKPVSRNYPENYLKHFTQLFRDCAVIERIKNEIFEFCQKNSWKSKEKNE